MSPLLRRDGDSFARNLLLLAGFLTASLALSARVRAQQATDSPADALDQRIIAEAQKGSELMANLTYLSDIIGHRLTGSASLKKANDWTAEKMKSYGLVNVQLEPWSIPEGWERGPAYAWLMEPDIGRSLSLASYAWMPGTNGRITAPVVAVDAKDPKELEALRGKLEGAVILDGPPKKLPSLEDAYKEAAKGDLAGRQQQFRKKGDKSFEEIRALAQECANLLKKEGVAVVLRDAGKHHGLLFTTGSWSGRDRASAGNPTPTAAVAHNHYELLWRLATRKPEGATRIEVEINNKFIPGPVPVYNTVGEIRGSEKPDEFVICGAHLDSWDLGQGTVDNGTGSCVVLEAARILSKIGVQPKRTIRFVLFTGEEQGLHGSRQYCEKHKDEMAKVSAALVHDTGPGKVLGIGLANYPGAQKMMIPELATLKELGVTNFNARSGGGSDHMSFAAQGIPGIMFSQDTREYFLYTHHSQADTLDRVRPEGVIQGAQVMAITAMRIANLENLLPREEKKSSAK